MDLKEFSVTLKFARVTLSDEMYKSLITREGFILWNQISIGKLFSVELFNHYSLLQWTGCQHFAVDDLLQWKVQLFQEVVAPECSENI